MNGPLAARAAAIIATACSLVASTSGGTVSAREPKPRRAADSIEIRVTETAGIRRFGYPVHALVPLPKGTLKNVDRVRLLRDTQEIAAQFGVAARWDDGSVQWAAIDFNASPPPLATEKLRLQYGPDVERSRKPRGLTVTETADAFQVGLFRFRKDGWPLVESCKHSGAENIGQGTNGLVVTDAAGHHYDFRTAKDLHVELVKPGPVHVVLRYRGRWDVGAGDPIQFETELGMPNSKSWWKVTHHVHDPHKMLRSIALHTPFDMGPPPLVWDFGTGSWTYGELRGNHAAAVLEQRVGPNAAEPWQVLLGPPDRPQLYEVPATTRPALAEGWGHLTANRVVAFAIAGFGRQPGLYRIALSADGAGEFHYTSPEPQETLDLTVYQHFVTVPVQIGAATSPMSMLNPLVARCPTGYYKQCGVPEPDEPR